MFDLLGYSFRAAARHFRQTPLVTLINIVALALGFAALIGAFSVVHYWNATDQSFPKANRIRVLLQRFAMPSQGIDTGFILDSTPAAASRLKTHFQEINHVARVTRGSTIAVRAGSKSAPLRIRRAEQSLLNIFAFTVTQGSLSDALATNGAIVTTSAATQLFGTDAAIGKKIRISQEYVVKAVVRPPEEPTLIKFDGLIPYKENPAAESNWVSGSVTTFLAVRSKAGLRGADAEDRLAAFVTENVPKTQLALLQVSFKIASPAAVQTMKLDAALFRSAATLSVPTLLMAVGALVFLISLINCITLGTAMELRRTKERVIHRIVGAHPSVVAGQLCVSALYPTSLAMALALLIIAFASPIAVNLIDISPWETFLESKFSLLFALALIPMTAVLGAAYPAKRLVRLRSLDLEAAATSPRSQLLAQGFICFQFAAAGALLTMTLIFSSQNYFLQRQGMATGNGDTLVALSNTPTEGFTASALRNRLNTSSHIKAIGALQSIPWSNLINVVQFTKSKDKASATSTFVDNRIAEGLFDVIEPTVLAGRLFRKEELSQQPSQGAMTPIVIDETAAV